MAKASASERFVIGVDLGGTNIVVGAVAAADGRTLAVRSQATRSELGAESIVSRIGEMVDEVRSETSMDAKAFLGVGVGAPGPLDRAKGVVIFAPNLGWRDMPLRDLVRQRTGLPTTLDNDANCATLGEWWCGAARGGRNVIGITIGTGIGGGLIIDGQLYHGASDIAGEVGHMSIDSQGRWCKCGNYGCLEAYTSGSAIATRARECLVADQDGSSLPSLVDGDLSRITAQTVFDAARGGDALAIEVVRDTARFLGAGIANLLNVFNPDVVVVAGGVTQAGDALFEPLRAEVRKRAFRPAVSCCRVVPGSLPGTAGVVGAAKTFLMQHERERHTGSFEILAALS